MSDGTILSRRPLGRTRLIGRSTHRPAVERDDRYPTFLLPAVDDLQIGDLSLGPIDARVGEHPPAGVDMIIGVDALA